MKHEPRPAIHMEKQLGQGGVSGDLKVGQTVLARLMDSQIWHQISDTVEESLGKGQWPLLSLMPDTSVSSSIPLVIFKLLPQCWNSEGVILTLSVHVLVLFFFNILFICL